LTGPGRVVAPILLYHHVSSDGGGSRYFVDTENFRQQMKALQLGLYQHYPLSGQVLIHGGELPARPVIITFDDGNLDVYANAFPIMQKMGFVGTMYIVAERLGNYNMVNAEQLAEMTAAGWEIGSHTMSHSDLTYNHWQLDYELQQSRSLLEDTLGVPVLTLAYPYGLRDDFIVEWAKEYGYIAGMGLGTFNEHTLDTLFFLSRREVYSEYDMTAFSTLLPWTQPLNSP
jgi:peptidoglycan/xylan/chitin deacetylase (PgdA/CDA1 family)